MSPHKGFTLVEALLAIATLALLATGLATLYASGHRAIALQGDDTRICSALRGEVERMIATPFTNLVSSETVLDITGQTYTSIVTKVAIDMNGDAAVETNAASVTVAIDDYSVTVLRVDDAGRVRKQH